VEGYAITAWQFVGNNDWAASSLVDEQTDEKQRGKDGDKEHEGHEPLEQREPEWHGELHMLCVAER
jgi:hypothetical protein